jgi:hypothetical protein
MGELIPYPESLDLRRLTRDIHRYRPTTKQVEFTGTVKVHAMDITIVFRNGDGGRPPQIQSRNRIITSGSPETDNSGAAVFLTPWLGMPRGKIERTLAQ